MKLKKQKTALVLVICVAIVALTTTLVISNNSKVPATVIGKVINVKALGVSKIRGRIDEVTFVYSLKGKDYLKKQKIGVRFPKQAIGNRVKVEYDKNHPEECEVIGFYSDYELSRQAVAFYASKKYGYHSIELINDLYFYTNYADSGKVINTIIGEYITTKDTLIVQPFNYDVDNNYRTVKYVLVETPNRRRRYGIKNISNNRIFY